MPSRWSRWLPAALAAAGAATPARAQEPAALPPVDAITAGPATPTVLTTPADGGGVGCDACKVGGFDFKNVPPAPRPAVRSGYFGIFPDAGKGYYSALDCLTGTERDARPKFPLPPFVTSTLPFYELDYRYVDDPKYDPDVLERLKRVRLGDDWLFGTGGQAWFRYESQYNGSSRLGNPRNRDNVFGLYRVRPYVDLWYQDKFRVFAEGMFADSVWQDLRPLASEVDRADFQNLFVEAKVGEVTGKGVYARVGRQEVQFGSQRLVGTPDWANVRSTFNGVRVLRTGEQWDVDAFWLQPRVITQFGGPNSIDNNQNFAGVWATHRPKKGTTRDYYFLFQDNTNRVAQQGVNRAPVTNYTLGSRYAGDVDNTWLYDFEGAVQLGRRGTNDIVAGFVTGGVGHHWKDAAWKPVLWAYYDYASGDHRPNSRKSTTFNQLYPFGHYYFGYVDAVGRQNIHDVNFQLWAYPSKWITTLTQFHNFWLDSGTDALYNYTGAAIRRDPTGRAGRYVGSELDYIVNLHLTKRADFFAGYSYLWGGDFLRRTQGPNASKDASLAYFSYSYRW